MQRKLSLTGKIFFTCVAIVLIAALVPVTYYATEAIGSRIEVERIDGTAYVVKANGKKSPARAGLKLSAKESLQTDMGSYAFLGIDEDKVIKVDELSQINIVKKNNKLKVNIEEGSIMFEVKNPIPEPCEMSLDASTMAMSIRGTAGIIGLRRIGDNIVSAVELVDGRVDMTYSDIAGKGRNFTLWGGESALHKDGSDTVDRDLIDVTAFPGFAAVELEGNPELCEKMLEKSGLNTKWPIEHAQELLQKGQEHNRENYYDVFEEGNVHSVASLKGYVDSVMKIAVDEGLDEPAPKISDVENEPILPTRTPTPTPTPVDEHLKKYGQPIAVATPAPDGYQGPNTISWDEYVSRRKQDEDNGNNSEKKNEIQKIVSDDRIGYSDHTVYGPSGYFPYNEQLPNTSSSANYNTGGSSNDGSGKDPYGDDDDSSSSSSKKKMPTPTPEPTEEPKELFTVRFFDPKSETPDIPILVVKVENRSYSPVPDDPVHEGFTFTGWTEGLLATGWNYITAEVDFYAHYKEDEKKDTFNVRFFDPKADVPTQPIKEMYVKKGEFATPPDDPVHKGFKFTGWEPDINTEITKETSFYAIYEESKMPTVKVYVFDEEETVKRGSLDEPVWADLSSFVDVFDEETIRFNDDFQYQIEIRNVNKLGSLYACTRSGGPFNRDDLVFENVMEIDLTQEISRDFHSNKKENYEYYLRPYFKATFYQKELYNFFSFEFPGPAGSPFSSFWNSDLEKQKKNIEDAGYEIDYWEADPEISSNYLFTNTTYQPVCMKKPVSETFTLKFYRWHANTDGAVIFLGSEEVEKGTDGTDTLMKYMDMVKEEIGTYPLWNIMDDVDAEDYQDMVKKWQESKNSSERLDNIQEDLNIYLARF